MTDPSSADQAATPANHAARTAHGPAGTHPAFDRLALLYARLALGAAFLSAVADRFGLWGKHGGWGNFTNFTRYTAHVLSFLPAATIPFFAWAATVGEIVFGVALIFGLWVRWAALGSAVLLLLFGVAMAISLGIKAPLDYSVFSASAAALLIALFKRRESRAKS